MNFQSYVVFYAPETDVVFMYENLGEGNGVTYWNTLGDFDYNPNNFSDILAMADGDDRFELIEGE